MFWQTDAFPHHLTKSWRYSEQDGLKRRSSMLGSLGVLAMALVLGALGWWVDHTNRKSMKSHDDEQDKKSQ